MRNTKSITFREFLLAEAVAFLAEQDMSCLITQEGIPDLIEQLLHYEEEGSALFPHVFILDDLDSVLKLLPNSHSYLVGSGPKTADTMLRAVKKCAPLAVDGWAVYIHRLANAFDYGVFRAGTSAISVPIAETIIDETNSPLKAVLVHQIADKLIEVKGIVGDNRLVNYRGRTHVGASPVSQQLCFIETILKKVPDKLKDPTRIFLVNLFAQVLERRHGTLACVIGDGNRIPQKLADGNQLGVRINIPATISELLATQDLHANAILEGQLSLIRGMMQSDGITVFTQKGEVVAYNVFVKHPKDIATTTVSGGARSRTFLTLKKMIGRGLTSAYIQSQDGEIKFSDA